MPMGMGMLDNIMGMGRSQWRRGAMWAGTHVGRRAARDRTILQAAGRMGAMGARGGMPGVGAVQRSAMRRGSRRMVFGGIGGIYAGAVGRSVGTRGLRGSSSGGTGMLSSQDPNDPMSGIY